MQAIDPTTEKLKQVSVQNWLAEQNLMNAANHARAMKKTFRGIVGSKSRKQYAEQVIGDYGLAGR